MTAPYTTFSTMQNAGVARPPQNNYFGASTPYGGYPTQPQTPAPAPSSTPTNSPTSYQPRPTTQTPAPTVPSSGANPPTAVPGGTQLPLNTNQVGYSPVPDLSGMWGQLYNTANIGYGAPNGYQSQGQFNGYQPSQFQPGNYQGPGQFNAYQGSQYDPGQYQNGGSRMGANGQPMQFQNGPFGGIVDAASFGSILGGLQDPSRYGAPQVAQAYDVMNRKLTQQGDVDAQKINEDMARRGLYSSTVAGGRLGDLATNLNQQRSDLASNLLTDQAKNYQSDRASAIAQALGYGGQQFGQSLGGFNANLGAQGQNFGQNLASNQFNEGLSQNAYQNSLGRLQYLLGQNNQNFGQQAQQYGANQQEAQNAFQGGLAGANFGLNQNQQNFGQLAGQYGANQQEAQNQANSGLNTFQAQQGSNQQTFNQMLAALTGQQGFQQQGFNNQLATQQTNNNLSQQQLQFLMQLFGGVQ